MKNKVDLSIIIPLYNTPDEYILRCIDSILKQEYDKYEIIIVDDGSDEQQKDILRSLSQSNSKVRFIEKEHSGVSNTRNTGIRLACGEYVAFVDADDTVSEMFIKEAMDFVVRYHFPDIIIGGIKYIPYRIYNNTQYGNMVDFYQGEEIELLKKSLLHIKDKRVKYNILGSPCAKLFKRSLLADSILFPEDIALCEDQIFNRVALMRAKSVVVVPCMWYNYYQNNFSVMHTKVKTNFWEMKKAYWDGLLSLDNEESDAIKDGLRGVYIRTYINLAAAYCRDKSINDDVKKTVLMEAIEHPLIKLAINKLSWKSDIPISWKIQWFVVKMKKYSIINVLAHFVS